MSTEIISEGSAFEIKALDRAFGGRATTVLRVDDGKPDPITGLATGLGDIRIGGHSVLGTPSITTTSGAASNTVTLQLLDANGNAFRGVRRIYFWLSATAGATSVGLDVTGLTTTLSTGTLITAIAGMLTGDGLTTATGRAVVTLADAAGATTRYVNFAIDGKIYSSTAVVSPT